MPREIDLQRLFSTFANGLPGLGLMIQRFVTAAILVYGAITHLSLMPPAAPIDPQLADVGMGILLLVGLWTPAVGALIASRQLWIALSGASDPLTPLILATLGATLAMIGPGAWSIDARLFGRREIKPPR